VTSTLTGKAALVTGASQGIGRVAAEALARAGARTWLAARNADKLRETADGIRAAGGQAEILELDVADFASIDSRLEAVVGGGGVEILVNNAGVTDDGLLLRMSDEQWDRVVDVNLGGAFRVTRTLLRGMMKKRWGRIINVSSVVACAGNPGQANYAASKAGLEGFTRALAREVASRNITVNAVAPGYVETAMTAKLTDEQREKLLASVPAGRMGTPEDMAAAVLFLASEGAGYVTGQVIHVNGGMYM
jgi:3-oxoacyl-[acyl-carrier protein] reductase